MTRNFSLWLDLLRLGAALIVLLSHWAYERFTGGRWEAIRLSNVGSDAVILFFVISGLVIAYAAERDALGKVFAFNRVTRLLSVMIPALLLTYIFDGFGFAIDPAAYPPTYFQPQGFVVHMLAGGSLTQEWAVYPRLRLGSNGPLWSVSYEAAYYLLFGITVFLSGTRRFALLALAIVLIGPRVLVLMPAWLMGVWLWSILRSGPKPHPWAFRAAVLPWVIYLLCLVVALPAGLNTMTEALFDPFDYRRYFVFSDEFLWNALIGVLVTGHLWGVAHLQALSVPFEKAIRWGAGASFSIYVTHYPALQLLDAALPGDGVQRDLVLLIGSVLIGLVFAQIFERPLPRFRIWLRAFAATPR